MSKWTPQNDEPALTLAAIRWYAMSLEKLAMDLYLTSKDTYPQVKDVLSRAMQELGAMRNSRPKAMYATEDGCGPGYVNCDGVCLPECDNIAEY